MSHNTYLSTFKFTVTIFNFYLRKCSIESIIQSFKILSLNTFRWSISYWRCRRTALLTRSWRTPAGTGANSSRALHQHRRRYYASRQSTASGGERWRRRYRFRSVDWSIYLFSESEVPVCVCVILSCPVDKLLRFFVCGTFGSIVNGWLVRYLCGGSSVKQKIRYHLPTVISVTIVYLPFFKSLFVVTKNVMIRKICRKQFFGV